MQRFKGLLLILTVLLFSQVTLAQMYAHPKLVELREKCDSLDCPRQYSVTYRLLAEDLYIPLDIRIQYLEIAERISKELADNEGILAIYAQRGRINLDKGRYAEALKAFSDGIPYAGYKDTKTWLGQEGWFLTGYGMLLYRVRLYEDALEIFEDCASVMHRNKDDYGEAVALNNIGLCHINLENYDSAAAYFQRGYDLRKDMNHKLLLCHSLLYMARAERLGGNFSRADSLLQAAIDRSKDAKNKQYIGDIYSEWTELALIDNDLDAAAYYLNEAKSMDHPFRDLRWLNLKIDLFKRLKLEDSLHFYLDTALHTARDFGNLDLQVSYTTLKEEILRSEGKIDEANALLGDLNSINQKLIGVKHTLQREMMEVQSDFIANRSRLNRLEESNYRQEKIIETQSRTIFFTSIIVIILLVAFIIYYRFYTQLQRLSRRLNKLSNRSRLAANQMTTVVITLNQDEKVIFVNEAAKEHFQRFGNLSIEPGKDFLSQLSHPEMQEDWENHLSKVKEEKRYQSITSRVQDNRTYYHLVSISEMQSKDTIEGYVALLTDVTSSQEKSLELSQKTMALEKTNEAKDKVLSLLAHDLKEGVVSSSELARLSLDDSVPAEERKAHMEMILESLDRTKALLFKTLDWVNQQGDGIKVQMVGLFAGRLAEDLIKEKKTEIQRKDLKVTNQIDRDLEVLADPNALRVVLRNLIANAIKFVEPEVGQIEIKSRILLGNEVEISVSDNGRGMSSQQVINLMVGERLQSTEGTLGEQGTGTGLHLCQDLLFNMGSTLQVQSSERKGTVFYFKLDLK